MSKYGFIFFWFVVGHCLAQERVLNLPQTFEQLPIEKCLYLYEDTSAKASVESILTHRQRGEFKLTHSANLNFDLTTSQFWLLFHLKNQHKKQNLILEINNPGIDTLVVYRLNPANHQLKRIAFTGDRLPYEDRPILDKNFVIPFTLETNEEVVILTRVSKIGESVAIPVLLAEERYFNRANKYEYMIWGGFVGIIIFIVVFNIFLFIANQYDKIYLYYTAYILSIGIYICTGLGYEFLWHSVPSADKYDSTLFSITAQIFHLSFMQIFINQTKENSKWLFMGIRYLKYLYYVIAYTTILFIGINFFPSVLWQTVFMDIFKVGLICYIILLFASVIHRIRQHERSALFFFVSLLFEISSVLINLVVRLDWVTWTSTIFSYVLPIGILSELVVLSLGLSLRISAYRQEKEKVIQESLKQMIQVEEAERQRMAQDLHDDLGGTLSMIKGNLASLNVQFNNALAYSLNLVEMVIQDLRLVSQNLKSDDLLKDGLVKSVRQTVERMQRVSDIHFIFLTFGEEQKLSAEKEISIYRIIQELINNIYKHSKARNATIQLVYYADYLHVSIDDDGQGIKKVKKSTMTDTGIGLKNVYSRVNFLQGKFWIDSGDKRTIFMIEIPFHTN